MMTPVRRFISIRSRMFPAVMMTGLACLLPGSARAAVATTAACPCTLVWDASSDGSAAGYVVYYGLAGSSVTNRLDAGGARTATVYNLTVSSNYFFRVAAYNTARVEGRPSQTIFYRPVALSALHLAAQIDGSLNLQFLTAPGAIGSVQYSPSLQYPQWQTLASATADTNGLITITDPPSRSIPARYYRGVR